MAKVEHLTLLKPLEYSSLKAAMDAFVLSGEAARCTPRTVEHYTYTIGAFLDFLKSIGVASPQEITSHHIRRFLVGLQGRGLKDTTQHAHARGIKTWLRWLVAEGDLQESPMIRVKMPRLEQRVPPPFSPEDIRKLLQAFDRQSEMGLRVPSFQGTCD